MVIFRSISCLCRKFNPSFKTNNIKGVQKMIRINRRIIQSMDNEASVEIETDKLKNYVMSVKARWRF